MTMVIQPELGPPLSELDTQPGQSVREKNGGTSCTSTTFNNPSTTDSVIKGIIAQNRSDVDDIQMRTLGVMFRDLRVMRLSGVGAAVQHNVVSLLHPRSIMNHINTLRHPPLRSIISGFEGVVLPGEMLLVLGRPGSGCSTFLKTLANHRDDYHTVLGDVFYDSFTPNEIKKRYRGDVIYCPEDDIHFPTLTVGETLKFACNMRTPSHLGDNQSRTTYAGHTTDLLLRGFGLEHARHTVVGDASIRGISGGEKKRVSISEVMSARGKLICWDNSTRGLDSSTALEFIRALRTVADTAKVTTVVSIYQAGERLFNLFDKVCVIYEGKMAYFGPAREAKRYFMDMGYEPQNRQTTSDFLVSVTDPKARVIRPGLRSTVPRTADEMSYYFMESAHGQLNRTMGDSYSKLYVNKPKLKVAYDTSATSEHARHAPHNQPYVLSIPMQVQAVMRRRWQILKGDRITQIVQVGTQVFQAIFIGTVFLQVPENTAAYFSRGSVLFFALFCGSIATMSEIPALFSQRQIVRRHQRGALYYPFIDSLAHTIVDIPITLISLGVMSTILYVLAGLQKTVGQFFTFFLFTFMVTLVMKTCFRSIAAFSTNESSALTTAAMIVMPLIMYAGYATPLGDITLALRWISYINPLRYAFESLMVNEFHTINGTCTTLVPSGPGYENTTLANQVCVTVGSRPGSVTVAGDAYTYQSFGYSHSHLWRNLGILGIFTLGLLGTLLFFTQCNRRTAWDTVVTLYKEGSDRVSLHQAVDEEKLTPGHLHEKHQAPDAPNGDVLEDKPLQPNIFSWKNIEHEVPVSRGVMRRLLDDVSGYVAPGKLTALMGESGAGKTTLLNLLAQRISVGVVHGDCLVNGHQLPADFQAQTAYVQQMDVHIPETTVREALLFSARLRRPSSISMAEKEAYVEKCLKMCGLEAHADAIVGSLDPEHKKRTTIGVELAAKPKLLLFLDEPTSGLDSQSAWAIATFLRELANRGQAVLCTIHQPSGELFQVFDRLLLLRKGGQTVYFGDIGERSTTLIEYFERNGAPSCAEDANPAEYVLEVIGAGATATCAIDWNNIWKESPEAAKLNKEIGQIHRNGQSRPITNTGPQSGFASTWMKQLALLTHRGFVCYWRDPMYIYSKLIASIVSGLIIGFTVFGVTNSLQGCQDRLFSVYMALVSGFSLGQQTQGKFIESRTVYEIRESPSRMFTWSAFLVSQILIEVPWNIFALSLFFVCWYWTTGLNPSHAGFSYLIYSIIYPLYTTTFAQAVAVISPTPVVGTTFLGAAFSFLVIYTGVIQRYSELGWWKWMYYVSPYMYITDGLFGQALSHQLIICATNELVTIEPPLGMSCDTYMDPYISFAGGYLTNPNATSECAFCPFRTTDEFMQLSFNISSSHYRRDLVVVLAMAAFNVLFMFAGMYFFRVRKGPVFSLARIKHRVAPQIP